MSLRDTGMRYDHWVSLTFDLWHDSTCNLQPFLQCKHDLRSRPNQLQSTQTRFAFRQHDRYGKDSMAAMSGFEERVRLREAANSSVPLPVISAEDSDVSNDRWATGRGSSVHGSRPNTPSICVSPLLSSDEEDVGPLTSLPKDRPDSERKNTRLEELLEDSVHSTGLPSEGSELESVTDNGGFLSEQDDDLSADNVNAHREGSV